MLIRTNRLPSLRLTMVTLILLVCTSSIRAASSADDDDSSDNDDRTCDTTQGESCAPAAKVVVVSIMQGPMKDKEWIPITKQNHEAYCRERGYTYVLWDQNLSERTPHWEKLEAILELMEEDYDILYWTDADSIFTNFSMRIEDLLPLNDWKASTVIGFIVKFWTQYFKSYMKIGVYRRSIEISVYPSLQEGKHFAFSGDWNIINSGHWAVRNSDWAAEFLEDILEFYPMPFPNWDNAAFSIICHNSLELEAMVMNIVLLTVIDHAWRMHAQGCAYISAANVWSSLSFLIRFINRQIRADIEEGRASYLISPKLRSYVALHPKRSMNGYPGDWRVGDPVLHTVDRQDHERIFWTSLVLDKNGYPVKSEEFEQDIKVLDEQARAKIDQQDMNSALELYHRALLSVSIMARKSETAVGSHPQNCPSFLHTYRYFPNIQMTRYAFMRLNRPWKAANAFQRAVDNNPEDADAWRSRFYQIWQYPLAIAALKEASRVIAEQTEQEVPALNELECGNTIWANGQRGDFYQASGIPKKKCELVDLSLKQNNIG
eukprot:jgi/Bigna1/81454/fgenesh1_pg.80_\